MDVSVEHPGGLKRRLKVQIPAERVNNVMAEKIEKVGRNARIPGFRPGKVPKKVLYQRYGSQVRQEVVGELIQTVFPEAVEQSELAPAGSPEIEVDSFETNGPLAFTASFDVYPEIELQGLDSIEVEKPVAEVTEADVDRNIERLREQHKSWEEVDREAADGDRVVVDFSGHINDQAFEGGSAEDVEIDIGAQRFLPDLERSLVGRRPGEVYSVEIEFPADYTAEELAGKAAVFDVTVKQVKQGHMPELDAAFVEQMGVEEGTVEALRGKFRESLEQEAKNAIDLSVKTQVLDALYTANPIAVPEPLVAEEINNMRKEAMQRLPQLQGDEEQAKQLFPDADLHAQAEKRVALSLLANQVITDQGIEYDQDKVDEMLDEVAADYGDQAPAVKTYHRQNPHMMEGIQAMAMEQQVVDILLENATVTEQEKSLDELLDSHRQQG